MTEALGTKRRKVIAPDGSTRYVYPQHADYPHPELTDAEYKALRALQRTQQHRTPAKREQGPPADVVERVYALAQDYPTWRDVAAMLGINVSTLRDWRKHNNAIDTAFERGKAVATRPVISTMRQRAMDPDDKQGVAAANTYLRVARPDLNEQQPGAQVNVNVNVLPQPSNDKVIIDIPPAEPRGKDLGPPDDDWSFLTDGSMNKEHDS